MARTKSGKPGGWRSKSSGLVIKKKNKRTRNKLKRNSLSRMMKDAPQLPWLPYMSQLDVDFISGFAYGSHLHPQVIDLEELEMSPDEMDNEVMFGTLRTDIVGIQYYKGTVNNGEMVSLEREPQNVYDHNAIRVTNLDHVQVGHLKREVARALAFVLDNSLAKLEGVVPYGATNMYKMTVDLTLWGQPENKQRAVDVLRSHGLFMKVTSAGVPSREAETSIAGNRMVGFRMAGPNMAAFSIAGPSYDYSHVVTHRQFLSPAEVKNELDKLFESLQEDDKTTMMSPAQAIKSELYPHQKQGLNWLISRENANNLPPFWEKRKNGYFNSLTMSTSSNQPKSIRGGILADDMGLGKTLEIISLILTNFVDKQPLAQPVPGRVRASRHIKAHKRKRKQSLADELNRGGKDQATEETACPFEKIRALEAEIDSLDDQKENSQSGEDGPCSVKEEKAKLPFRLQLKQDSSFVEVSGEGRSFQMKSEDYDSKTRSVQGQSDLDLWKGLVVENSASLKEVDANYLPEVDFEVKRDSKSARPRRCAKKPARYTFSDTDEDVACEKVNEEMIDQGTGQGHGRGRGKGATWTGGKGKGKSKGKVRESSCPPLPRLDMDELPDLEMPSSTQDGEVYIPDESDTDSSDDELPDVQVPFKWNEAGLSNCDMTTGRTHTDGARATLIICPLSVLSNWLDQFEEHLHDCVNLEIYTYYGGSRTKDVSILARQDVVLTTYSTLSADAKTKERPLHKVDWLRVVLDEGHVIRNPKAQQTKAVMELKAQRRWVLTGTPIQNSMKDLWSLINFLQVSPLTERQWWYRTIERPLALGDKCALKYFREGTLLHNYGQVLAILMRLRQMCCHPSLVARAAEAVKDTQDFLDKLDKGENADEAKQKLVETLLMVLKSGSDEECAVCLDSLKNPVITPCAHVYCRRCIVTVINNEKPNSKCPLCRGDISEARLIEVPPEHQTEHSSEPQYLADWQSSAKVDALMSSLVKLRTEDPTVKSLVVSQFTSFLTLLEVPLRANGFRFARLDGSMSAGNRVAAIQEFSESGPETPTIFLLSLKAGGVGVNLTAASRVFLMDPAWNPAAEDQCFDRCHRLGQTKDVVITKFLVEESVEERMLQLQEKKRLLMQGAFGQKQSAEQRRQTRISEIKNLLDL
ncbi:helicase-like transcription factor isoform X2 [Haliotis asinina]|uniref:helicase-like transcription factor isoform X2 n=1 Tax=Haliotis asinina TaxID=109174 RepID=UPI0035327719